MPLFPANYKFPRVMSRVVLDLAPAGTTIETVDSYTVPANTLVNNGDSVDINWRIRQVNANSCTVTVDVPTIGSSMIADARALTSDRYVNVHFERLSATVVRRTLRYMYASGIWYEPASLTTSFTDALAAFTTYLRFTNPTAAGDMKVISREVIFTPGV